MLLELVRFSSGRESTLGLLFQSPRILICGTLEDEYRTVKKYGETRIPAGRYELGLRTKNSSMHQSYAVHRDEWIRANHRGMVEILHIPDFTDVYFHIGNKDDDTAGCVLTGDILHLNLEDDGYLGASTQGYKRFYKIVGLSLSNGIRWEVEVIDYA